MERTDKQYWNEGYRDRGELRPVGISSYRNHCNLQTYRLKQSLGLVNRDILEVGGGGSGWVARLAGETPESRFTVLDYSEAGCALLADYAVSHDLSNIEVVCGDFFKHDLGGRRFDLVYSHGVVEHFEDLGRVLGCFARYLDDQGLMLTIIPNMAGVLGRLTRWLNQDVYDKHVPYDLPALVEGHKTAGLQLVDSGYLCSNNFSVLSSCVTPASGFKWRVYQTLARISRLAWLLESRIGGLPRTAWLSPYIYVVARHQP